MDSLGINATPASSQSLAKETTVSNNAPSAATTVNETLRAQSPNSVNESLRVQNPNPAVNAIDSDPTIIKTKHSMMVEEIGDQYIQNNAWWRASNVHLIPTRENVHEAIGDFTANYSGHGLKYMFESGAPCLRRLTWIIAFLSLVTITIYFAVESVQAYMQNKTTTTVRVDGGNDPVRFPALTACGMRPYHRHSLNDPRLNQDFNESFIGLLYAGSEDNFVPVEYPLTLAGNPVPPINTTWARYMHEVMAVNLTYDGEHPGSMTADDWMSIAGRLHVIIPTPEIRNQHCMRFEEFVEKCTYEDNPCPLNWWTESIDMTYCKCWTLTVPETARKVTRGGNGLFGQQLSLEFDTHTGDSIPFTSIGNGVRVVIHEPESEADPASYGKTLAPGEYHEIGFKKRIIEKLPHPFSTCAEEWTGGTGVKHPCTEVSILSAVAAACDCNLEFYSNSTGTITDGTPKSILYMPMCGANDSTCVFTALNDFEPSTTCDEACISTSYEPYDSSIPFPDDESAKLISMSIANQLIQQMTANQCLLGSRGALVYPGDDDDLLSQINDGNLEILAKDTDINPELFVYHNCFGTIRYYRTLIDPATATEALQAQLVAADFFYQELKTETFTDSAKMGIFGAFSAIGGLLGLFIGMSFVSVFELLEFLIILVYFGHQASVYERYREQSKRVSERASTNTRRSSLV